MVVAGLLMLTGCGAKQDEVTMEDLTGVWHRTGFFALGDLYIQFNTDETYRLAQGAAERVESNPAVEGEVWFENGQLHVKDLSGVGPEWEECVRADQTGTYAVSMLENGNIKIEPVEDECRGRVTLMLAEFEPAP
jgi:hypothetical protein